MNERYQGLVRLVQEQAGENFRSAFRYDEDDWTALYVREDLATPDLQQAVPALARRARDAEPLIRERDYQGLGPQQASISLHAKAVLIHFREGEDAGVIVTLDKDVARNLADFVARCEGILEPSAD
ncbi:hypothetical protein [Halolamina salina]|uniref:Uncharacterized protein n=1 Tax=Halolamina salina TaxID=1220023 RepID=A0ABD6B9I3_9EURY